MKEYKVYRYENEDKEIYCPSESGWVAEPKHSNVVRLEVNTREKTYYIICRDFDYLELASDTGRSNFMKVVDVNFNTMLLNVNWISRVERLRRVEMEYAIHGGSEKMEFLVSEGMEAVLEDGVVVLKRQPCHIAD